jgi:CubicO group peptidase (beta-lactamase class C family)
MERGSQGHGFSNVLKETVFEPLGMTSSGLLDGKSINQSIFAIGGLNMSQAGEPGYVHQSNQHVCC